MPPDVTEELSLYKDVYHLIAGLDEAGRGCWAGPVVAAAVVLPLMVLHKPHLLSGVNDSKQLTELRREKLYDDITHLAVGWGVGVVPAHVIDTHGILVATHLAMQIALLKLPQLPDALLIDAVTLKNWPCPQRSFVRGDARCLSIAAASIIAKVSRDRLMMALRGIAQTMVLLNTKGMAQRPTTRRCRCMARRNTIDGRFAHWLSFLRMGSGQNERDKSLRV